MAQASKEISTLNAAIIRYTSRGGVFLPLLSIVSWRAFATGICVYGPRPVSHGTCALVASKL